MHNRGMPAGGPGRGLFQKNTKMQWAESTDCTAWNYRTDVAL